MRTELMGGQYLDMLEQPRTSPAAARSTARPHVIRYKSAQVHRRAPAAARRLRWPAPTPSCSPAYSAYGLPLGEAFQLRDDVLGVFGDPAETGKPAGDDLREGKRTVLVAAALERRDAGAGRATVRRQLGDPRLDASGVDALREVIVDTGALDEVERLIAALTDRGAGGARRRSGRRAGRRCAARAGRRRHRARRG